MLFWSVVWCIRDMQTFLLLSWKTGRNIYYIKKTKRFVNSKTCKFTTEISWKVSHEGISFLAYFQCIFKLTLCQHFMEKSKRSFLYPMSLAETQLSLFIVVHFDNIWNLMKLFTKNAASHIGVRNFFWWTTFTAYSEKVVHSFITKSLKFLIFSSIKENVAILYL